MASIIFGVILMVLGLWGIAENWYAFLDFLWVFVPLLATVGGAIALISGIYSLAVGAKQENI